MYALVSVTPLDSGAAALTLCQLRQVEVQNLHSPIFDDEKILVFQATVHDPLLVRCCQRLRDCVRCIRLRQFRDAGAQESKTTLVG